MLGDVGFGWDKMWILNWVGTLFVPAADAGNAMQCACFGKPECGHRFFICPESFHRRILLGAGGCRKIRPFSLRFFAADAIFRGKASNKRKILSLFSVVFSFWIFQDEKMCRLTCILAQRTLLFRCVFRRNIWV